MDSANGRNYCRAYDYVSSLESEKPSSKNQSPLEQISKVTENEKKILVLRG